VSIKDFRGVGIAWIVFGVYVYLFLYPADVFLNSITVVASLGVLHSSDIFSQVVSLFLEPSFLWWVLFVIL
jgi:hypothetical protein